MNECVSFKQTNQLQFFSLQDNKELRFFLLFSCQANEIKYVSAHYIKSLLYLLVQMTEKLISKLFVHNLLPICPPLLVLF